MKFLSLTLFSLMVLSCKKNDAEPAKGSASKPAATTPAPDTIQKLLANVGKSATPSPTTQLKLGELLGKPGSLGGVTGDRVGITGSNQRDPDDPDPATAPSAAPAAPVALPPPAPRGGDCDAVAGRLEQLVIASAQAQLGGDAADQAAQSTLRNAAALARKQFADQCTQLKWPQNLKDCILTAADAEALTACEQLATPEMREAARNMSAAGADAITPPTTPAPKWTGGSECTDVAARAAALVDWQLSNAPAEVRATAADAISQLKSTLELQCKSQNWPQAARQCFVDATTVDALSACGTT